MKPPQFLANLRRLVSKPGPRAARDFVQQHDFLLFDFAYSNLTGHHHALNQLLRESFDTIGMNLGVLANQSLQAPTMPAVLPYFKRNVYGRLYTLAEWQRRKSKVKQRMTSELGKLSLHRWAGRGVLVHTISAFHLFGLLEHWVERQLETPLILYLMLPPEFDLAPGLGDAQKELYRAAFTLASRLRVRPIFLCENALLAQEFTQLAGAGMIRELMLPVRFPDLAEDPGQHSSRPAALYIGDAREDKGIDLLMACLSRESVRRLPVTIRLLITGISDDRRQHLTELRGDNIEVVFEDFLPTERYYQAIARSDLVLLPYQPQCYRIKNSNVLSEALGMGVPALLPSGPNSLLDFASDHAPGACVSMDDYSVESLEAALEAAISGLRTMKTQARAAMPCIRSMRSVSVFARAVEQCVGGR